MKAKDIHYEKLYYKSGDNIFNFDAYRSLASLYMKMVREHIIIINAALKLKDLDKRDMKTNENKGKERAIHNEQKRCPVNDEELHEGMKMAINAFKDNISLPI